MNWKGPLPLTLPGSGVGFADSDKYWSKTGPGQEGAAGGWPHSCSVLHWAPESLGAPTLPNRPTNCSRGGLQAQCCSIWCFEEMPKTDMFMWNLPVKTFFFLPHVREGQTKPVYGPGGLTSLQPLHLTLPVIIILYSWPSYPQPYPSKLDSYRKDSSVREYLVSVWANLPCINGTFFCLLCSFSFLCS